MFLYIASKKYQEIIGASSIEVLALTHSNIYQWVAVRSTPILSDHRHDFALKNGHLEGGRNEVVDYLSPSTTLEDISTIGHCLWLDQKDLSPSTFVLMEHEDNEDYLYLLPDITFYA